jgi:hypothetical protein
MRSPFPRSSSSSTRSKTPALLSEAIDKPDTQDPDELAIDTLLHGAGPRG